MLRQQFIDLFERDLLKLKEEISAYAQEDQLWLTPQGISNSAGNLCLHLIGNLNHFIGVGLANTGYIREREKEFSQKNVPREKLLNDLGQTREVVKAALIGMSEADFGKDFPIEKQGQIVSTMHMLLHLFGHLSYHLGQINYHRRLLAH